MGLLHRIFMILLLVSFGQCFFAAQDLDSLLSSLSTPKGEQPAVEPQDEPEAKSPVVDDSDEPATTEPSLTGPEAKQIVETQPDEPSEPQAKESEPVEPPVTQPDEPEVIEPKAVIATPVMPKNIISNVAAKSAEIDSMPKVMPKAPISPAMNPVNNSGVGLENAAKMTAAPTPMVSKSTNSSPVQIVDVHEAQTQGLDTLNIDSGGNWLEKRIWYQKGEQLFEVIRTNLQKAADLRMKFVHEVNQIGQQIDDFYENVSFQKGQVDEMLSAVLQALAQETQVRGGDLGSSERSLKAKIQAEQKSIEAVSKDLQLITDLDEQIDKTMMKSFKEIDTCRGLETRAWNHFKEIGLELDDKKARVLYYEMENIHKNIEQKMAYLQNNLLPYLQNQLVAKVNETMTQIKTNVHNLDSKGLSLNKLLQKDEHGDLLILKERELLTEKQAEDLYKAEQEAKAKAAKALKDSDIWYCKIWCLIGPYVQPVLSKIYDWSMIIVCCVQSVFCKLQEWICRLLGY